MGNNILITGEVLHQKWKRFADLAGVVEDKCLNLSEGWLAHFKTRNGLKQFKCHSQAGSADPEKVERERWHKMSGVKGNKTRLTYTFTANATGSKKLLPMVIGKAYKLQAFGKKTGMQLGFYYSRLYSCPYMYQEWLQQWDQELVAKNHKILLLQDNFLGHIVPDGLQNICVENFEANLTAHVQPMDQGIIQCFKARHCRASFIEHAIDK
ncbi:hypothetical protein L208DRAFT_1069958, partial [Tricholoma matsutake]